jgi:hypothetical protein
MTNDGIDIFRIGGMVETNMEGRREEQHVPKGVPSLGAVSKVARNAWNAAARPKGPATALD